MSSPPPSFPLLRGWRLANKEFAVVFLSIGSTVLILLFLLVNQNNETVTHHVIQQMFDAGQLQQMQRTKCGEINYLSNNALNHTVLDHCGC